MEYEHDKPIEKMSCQKTLWALSEGMGRVEIIDNIAVVICDLR